MKIFRTSHTFKHSRFKKCACTFVALWALFILSRFPSSVWTTSVGVPKPAELASFYKNMVESEWEWARNMSIVYTWVVSKLHERTFSKTCRVVTQRCRMDQKANIGLNEYWTEAANTAGLVEIETAMSYYIHCGHCRHIFRGTVEKYILSPKARSLHGWTFQILGILLHTI